MAGEWKTFTLGELCPTITDGAHQSPKSVDAGLPMASVKDLTRFGIESRTARKISEEDFSVLVKQGCKPQIGDVLIAKDGNSALDTVCTVTRNPDYVLLSSVAILRPNNERLGSEFLKYYFNSVRTLDYLKSNFISGAAIPRVILRDFKKAEINIPPLPEQKAIAHVLGSLDDKIELNRRMNETLEGMAQALFKSCFVDFDPVIDNALAAGNPIPEPLAQRTETRRQAIANGTANREAAQAFPASFRFTEELGWIPEGWETQALYDVANFVNGAAYKSKDFSDSPNAIPVIKIAEVKNGITGQTKFTEVDKGEKYKIDNGDILLSWSGNPDTSIDTFIWINGFGYLNQHIFNVQLDQTDEKFYVYNLLKYLRPVFAEIARDKQTTGLGHFTAGDMKRLMVFKPEEVILEEFNRIASPVYMRAFESRLESQTLAKLRDVLLPKLISGELRISQAEKMVEEAIA